MFNANALQKPATSHDSYLGSSYHLWMIGQFLPHLCPKPAQTGNLQGSFTTSETYCQSKKQNLSSPTNHLVDIRSWNMYRKNSGKFDVQVSNKKCIHALMRKHCQIKVGGDSTQAGEVVANQNKLPFREEDNAFDYQWDNHNILTGRWQIMGLICHMMAEKLRLEFTHISYRNCLQPDCQSEKQKWGLCLRITGPK